MTAIKNGTLLVKDSNGNTARVATLSQTDITTLNTALTDIDTNSVSIQSLTNQVKTIQGRYVDVDTAQTITGKKTLTTTNKSVVTNIKVTNTDNTVTPTENLWVNAINVVDKNGKGEGALQFSRRTDGRNWVTLQSCTQNANGNDITSSIGVGLKADGTASTYAPKPSASSNDLSIATTSWVNDKVNPIKNNYVTTNTAQDISAPKTIVLPSNRHAIIVKDTGTDNTVTPTSTQWQSMTIAVDKNGKERACCQATLDADGYGRTKLMAIQQDSNGKNIYNNLELAIKPDGTRQTYISSSPASNSNDNSIATTSWVNSKISTGGGSNPVGTIIPFAGSSIPAGYLLCNGATVSRTTYANLFKVIGTTWGAGDGSTTFKLPDARGRFPEGANGNLGTYHGAGLPNITGELNTHSSYSNIGSTTETTGAFTKIEHGTGAFAVNYGGGPKLGLKASLSSAIYGASDTVQPLSFCVQYLIKY